MKISELFDSKKAVWSFEIFPPKPTAEIGGVERIVRELAELAPDYISVTCSAGGSGNSRTPEIAGIVKRAGVEPLAHLTCINSVRAEVDGALDKLAAEGVDNVLALRGDRIAGASDSPDFRHAVDLVRHIRARGEGVDIAGACYPECHPESETPEDDIRYLKEKVDAGVSHLNTQLFFDNEAYFAFLERLRAAGVSRARTGGHHAARQEIARGQDDRAVGREHPRAALPHHRAVLRRPRLAHGSGHRVRHRTDNGPSERGRGRHTPLRHEQRLRRAQDNGERAGRARFRERRCG